MFLYLVFFNCSPVTKFLSTYITWFRLSMIFFYVLLNLLFCLKLVDTNFTSNPTIIFLYFFWFTMFWEGCIIYILIIYIIILSILSNQENTIPGTSDSIGTTKMYIWEKRTLGTQILLLGFFYFGKFKELPGTTLLCLAFSTTVPKTGPKNGPKFKKRQKMTKTISPLLGDPK